MIRPDDPWYPSPPQYPTLDKPIHKGYPGVPIRLKLAAEFAAAYIRRECEDDNEATPLGIIQADKLIDEMNREEADDGK